MLLDEHRELDKAGFLDEQPIALPRTGLTGETIGAYACRAHRPGRHGHGLASPSGAMDGSTVASP
jgi:hypothetical protein